jgi:hypothetical protein
LHADRARTLFKRANRRRLKAFHVMKEAVN